MLDISVRKRIPLEEFSMINVQEMCVYFNHIIFQVIPDSFLRISTVERHFVSSGYIESEIVFNLRGIDSSLFTH